MALLTHQYYCPKLGMASEFRVLMPDSCFRGEEKPAGTLFLLPPQGDSGQKCLTESGIAVFLENKRIAAVIPPCLQGCFTDMVYGYPFYQSLKYLREYLKTYLPGLPLEKGKCAVAGFGISAIAAIRWTIEAPDFFCSTGAFGGFLDLAMEPQGYFTEQRLTDLFGELKERIEKRDEFLSDCVFSKAKNIHLFSSPGDPGYESVQRTAEALGKCAQLYPEVVRPNRLWSFLRLFMIDLSGR